MVGKDLEGEEEEKILLRQQLFELREQRLVYCLNTVLSTSLRDRRKRL